MHTKDARARGETEQRLDLLPVWREAPCYTERERAALAWTEAVTNIAATHDVSDEVYAQARAQFDDGSQADVSSSAVWTSSSPVATVAADGTATGMSAGTATLIAALGGQSGIATITVSPAALVKIELTPSPLSLTVGQGKQLIATATYSDNSTLDVTQTASWLSADRTVASVSNSAGSRGAVTPLKEGAVELSARIGMIVGKLQLTLAANIDVFRPATTLSGQTSSMFV